MSVSSVGARTPSPRKRRNKAAKQAPEALLLRGPVAGTRAWQGRE
jgi:hypothetical protein